MDTEEVRNGSTNEVIEESGPSEKSSRRSQLPLILALTAAFGGLLLICLFAGLIYCQTTENGCNLPGSSVQSEPTPTPFVEVVPPTFNNTQLVSAQVGDELIPLSIDPPTRLGAAGEDFAVQIGAVGGDGRWQPIVASERVAVWLSGTVINYVLAIQDTEENRNLMQSLERGEAMQLSTDSGRTYEFEFSSREVVPITKLDVFGQTTPGITVVLARNDQATDRMVIRGTYKVGEAAQSITPGDGSAVDGGNFAELGEVVQLGDLQLAVTAFDSRTVDNSPFSYFLVDYQIQNNSPVPLQAGLIQFTLVDSVGNQYALNLNASGLGNFQPLPQSLGTGQPLQATAGYEIPSGLDPSSLGWIVTRLDTGEEIEIRASLPASAGGSGVTEAVSADIRLDNVSLVANATSLLIQGSIANTGNVTLSIEQSEVQLVSNGASYLIQSTNPQFPWTVAPGEVLAYSLTVQKPIDSGEATFSVREFSWQLDNFR